MITKMYYMVLQDWNLMGLGILIGAITFTLDLIGKGVANSVLLR